MFTTFSGIADQALFMTDLVDFFAVQPTIHSKPELWSRLDHPAGNRVSQRFVSISRKSPAGLSGVNAKSSRMSESLWWRKRTGQDHHRKAADATVRSDRRPDFARRNDLREYDLEDLWKEIGVIFQDFVHYEMTASENIGVGNRRCEQPFRIRAAAMKTFAEKVIKKLPKGYDQLSAAGLKAALIFRAANGKRSLWRGPTRVTRSF